MAPLPASMSPRTRLISISVAIILVIGVLVLSFGPSPSEGLSKLAAAKPAAKPAPAPAHTFNPPNEAPTAHGAPTSHHIPEADRRWLIVTPMAAKSVQRRMIVRNTWQRFYHDDTPFVSKFVFARIPDIWKAAIRAENETYGDIIELPHLEESAHVANTIKTVEFFGYIRKTQPDRWDFVTKLDDDSFLDARVFWKTYLQPALAAGKTKEMTWGRTLHLEGHDWKYAGGQFYTFTNDLVKRVAELFAKNRIDDLDEDALPSRLMHEGGVNWNQTDLPSAIAFDYNGEDLQDPKQACPWAKPSADLTKWAHSVGPDSLNPHKMKTDEDYLKVVACWDEAGYIRKRPAKS